MARISIFVALAIIFLGASSAQEFTITLFATDLNGCDDTSACDAKVTIRCQKNMGSWTACGTAPGIQDDNFPLWPNRFIYTYVPSEQMRWEFDVVDEDLFFDDAIHKFQLDVSTFLDSVSEDKPVYKHNMTSGSTLRGALWIHKRTL